jgi:hypothetical protein
MVFSATVDGTLATRRFNPPLLKPQVLHLLAMARTANIDLLINNFQVVAEHTIPGKPQAVQMVLHGRPAGDPSRDN